MRHQRVPSSCLRLQRADVERKKQHWFCYADNPHKALGETQTGFVSICFKSNSMALWMCIPGAFFPYSSHYCLFCLFKGILLCQHVFFKLKKYIDNMLMLSIYLSIIHLKFTISHGLVWIMVCKPLSIMWEDIWSWILPKCSVYSVKSNHIPFNYIWINQKYEIMTTIGLK